VAARRVDPRAIARLLPLLEGLLIGAGFHADPPHSVWTGKYNDVRWVRNTWKSDQIHFGWRKPPVASYYLLAAWAVSPKRSPEVVAARLNPGYSRRKLVDHRLPNALPLVGGVLERHWCFGVISDAEFAIEWLDSCAMRDSAIQLLQSGDGGGPVVGSPNYSKALRFISRHAPVA
jgi:hypothetical protein